MSNVSFNPNDPDKKKGKNPAKKSGDSGSGIPPFKVYVPKPPFKGKPSTGNPGSGTNPSPGGISSGVPSMGCWIAYWVIVFGAILVLMLLSLILLWPAAVVPLGIGFGAALLIVLLAIGAAFLFCNTIACSIIRILVWAFMWSSWLTIILAMIFTNGLVLLLGLIYGIAAGLLTRWIWSNGCKPYPVLFKWP